MDFKALAGRGNRSNEGWKMKQYVCMYVCIHQVWTGWILGFLAMGEKLDHLYTLNTRPRTNDCVSLIMNCAQKPLHELRYRPEYACFTRSTGDRRVVLPN